jgi:phage terminase large subunit-like protein
MSVPVQQKKIYEYLPKNDLVEYAVFSEKRGFTNKIIIFKNGSIIRFKTYEQGRESWQGTAKDLIWLDEEPPEDIVSECKARLIDKDGTLLRTMTPLNGITYTYDEIVLNEKNNSEVEYWFWSTFDNKKINQDAAHSTIAQYSEKEAEVRSMGHFLNLTTGNAYYPFADGNIIKSFEYLDYRPLEISCDFNVDLMCWHIGQERNGKDYTFDYVELEGQANTELLCNMLKNKFVSHKAGWIFYGDIAGTARRPETSRTNWAIIKDNFPSATIYYQSIRNIKDRVDSLNSRLCNSNKEINYYITENCKRLIKDYRQVTWEMLLNKNKAGKLTHASDGESYKMFWKYPLTGKIIGKQW